MCAQLNLQPTTTHFYILIYNSVGGILESNYKLQLHFISLGCVEVNLQTTTTLYFCRVCESQTTNYNYILL